MRHLSLVWGALSAVFIVAAVAPSAASPASLLPTLVLLWPAIVLAAVALGYAAGERGERLVCLLMGKSSYDGSISVLNLVCMLPYFAIAWFWWWVRHRFVRSKRENAFDEICPGFYLGRFPASLSPLQDWLKKRREEVDDVFPPHCGHLIDLSAELPTMFFSPKRPETAEYLCVRVLDSCAPTPEDLMGVGDYLARIEFSKTPTSPTAAAIYKSSPPPPSNTVDTDGYRMFGSNSVFIYCANGRGRSACMMCVVLVMKGICADVKEAAGRIKARRPQVNMQPSQIRAAEEAIELWVAMGGPEKRRERKPLFQEREASGGGIHGLGGSNASLLGRLKGHRTNSMSSHHSHHSSSPEGGITLLLPGGTGAGRSATPPRSPLGQIAMSASGVEGGTAVEGTERGKNNNKNGAKKKRGNDKGAKAHHHEKEEEEEEDDDETGGESSSDEAVLVEDVEAPALMSRDSNNNQLQLV